MTAISSDYIYSNLYRKITADIADSVKHLQHHEQFANTRTALNEDTDNIGYHIQQVAYSYVEPSLVPLIQQFSLPSTDAEHFPKKSSHNYVADEDKNTPGQNTEAIADEITSENLFAENLYNHRSEPSFAYVTKAYQQAGLSDSAMISLAFGQNQSSLSRLQYAHNIYLTNFNINKQPTVRLDLMHPYNRSFDYRI